MLADDIDVHREIGITISGRPLGSNARVHWRKMAEDRKLHRDAAKLVALQELRQWERRRGLAWRTLRHADIVIVFTTPDLRVHDFDNLVSTVKPLLDGIVDARVIFDDSTRCIRDLTLRHVVVKGETSTAFLIDEIDE